MFIEKLLDARAEYIKRNGSYPDVILIKKPFAVQVAKELDCKVGFLNEIKMDSCDVVVVDNWSIDDSNRDFMFFNRYNSIKVNSGSSEFLVENPSIAA